MGERTDTQTKNEPDAVYKRVSFVQTPGPIIGRSENLWWRKAGFGVTFFPNSTNQIRSLYWYLCQSQMWQFGTSTDS